MDIHDFMRSVAKPMYVFRMASPRFHQMANVAWLRDSAQRKSAETRMNNATAEIEELVLAFADDIRKQRESS